MSFSFPLFYKTQLAALKKVSSQPCQELLWILSHITKKPEAVFLAQEVIFTSQQKELLEKMMHQRTVEVKPLQYLLGTVPFGELELKTREPVFIPRPETEEWVLQIPELCARHALSPKKILDMCCGSGSITLLLAHLFPNAQCTGVDISPVAVELAHENKKKNNISNAEFVQGDVLTKLSCYDKQYDVVVTNPPYLSPREFISAPPELLWEDPKSLVAPEEGYGFYHYFIALITVWRDEGKAPFLFVCEVGEKQGERVSSLLEESDLTPHIMQDSSKKDRAVWTFVNHL